MKERWRTIPSHPKYEVSDRGRVRRKPLKLSLATQGYLTVGLGKRKTMVHRLVLEAFVGPGPGMHANHRNGVKADNRLENLEWVTPAENRRHAFEVLGRSTRPDLTPTQRAEIREVYAQGAKSKAAVARQLGISLRSVYRHLGSKQA